MAVSFREVLVSSVRYGFPERVINETYRSGELLLVPGESRRLLYDVKTGKVFCEFPSGQDPNSGQLSITTDSGDSIRIRKETYRDQRGGTKLVRVRHPETSSDNGMYSSTIQTKTRLLGREKSRFYVKDTDEEVPREKVGSRIKDTHEEFPVEHASISLDDDCVGGYIEDDVMYELETVDGLSHDAPNIEYIDDKGRALVEVDNFRFCDATTGEVVFNLPEDVFTGEDEVIHSPDGRVFAIGIESNTLYDMDTGKPVVKINAERRITPGNMFKYARYTPPFKNEMIDIGGRVLLCDDMNGKYYDFSTGEVAFELPFSSSGVTTLAFWIGDRPVVMREDYRNERDTRQRHIFDLRTGKEILAITEPFNFSDGYHIININSRYFVSHKNERDFIDLESGRLVVKPDVLGGHAFLSSHDFWVVGDETLFLSGDRTTVHGFHFDKEPIPDMKIELEHLKNLLRQIPKEELRAIIDGEDDLYKLKLD